MKKKWRVKNNLIEGQNYGENIVVSDMIKFRGEKVTINSSFRIKENDHVWNWTPEMFEDEPAPECHFRRGDEVEVWDRDDDEEPAVKRIFVGYVPGAKHPYICVNIEDERNFFNGKEFDTTPWRHCRSRRLPDLKEGDPVIVWDADGPECRRFFVEWDKNGRIKCFADGSTKWTSKGRTTTWEHWRLPTEEELET